MIAGDTYVSKNIEKGVHFSTTSKELDALTTAESKILCYLAKNFSSSQIADELFISYKTVENHRNNISKKLKLSGTHSLVKFAISNKSHL